MTDEDVHDVYDFTGPVLGSGAFATVVMVTSKMSGTEYAMKQVLTCVMPLGRWCYRCTDDSSSTSITRVVSAPRVLKAGMSQRPPDARSIKKSAKPSPNAPPILLQNFPPLSTPEPRLHFNACGNPQIDISEAKNNPSTMRMLENEIEGMKVLNHPNIVRLQEVRHDPASPSVPLASSIPTRCCYNLIS